MIQAHTEEDLRQYISDGGLKFGNSLSQYLRRNAGLPVFEYMETYHGLQGTDACIRNHAPLNDMGDLGWEMMHVSTTENPEIVSIVWKRRKIETF
jgi:hypothetical protein